MAAATMTSGRPGPVNLDVLYNLFQESAEVEDEPAGTGFIPGAVLQATTTSLALSIRCSQRNGP